MIIAPPSATFWSSCPEIPNLNSIDLKRSGSMSVGLPSRLRRTSHQAKAASDTDADRQEQADGLATLLPDEDAQDQPAHPKHRQERTDKVDLRAARCRARP